MNAYLSAGIEALGDATRMAIFQRLAGGPMAVGELADQFPVSRPAVSQHLRVLKQAGLVTDTAAGTSRVYQISPAGVERLRQHFDQLWEQALGAYQNSIDIEVTGGKDGQKRSRKRRK